MNYSNRARAVGRPKKEARDAAVFIARMWRVRCLGETVAEADKWIIEHWADATPKDERVGITDPAHVRAAVRRAKQMWLKDCDLQFNAAFQIKSDSLHVVDPDNHDWLPLAKLGTDFEKDGCAILAVESLTRGSPRACIWMKGMRQAHLLKLVPIQDQTLQVPGS